MKKLINVQKKAKILLFLVLIGCISMTFLKPIAQNISYHLFADTRNLFSVPNFWNVLSNAPFLVIGSYGMFYSLYKMKALISLNRQVNYFVFFTGIFLTGIGSAYYHIAPDNSTLVWDRLPMTISFMSFFSIIIGEFVSPKNARPILFSLLTIGIISVIYWYITEQKGCGDLRLYIAVQFLPILLIPIILLLFKQKDQNTTYIWFVLLAYISAKVSETYDHEIYHALNFISGHSIKHFFAALAPLLFLLGISKSRK